MSETLGEFFEDRAGWFELMPVQCAAHGTWQVALMIDGHYSLESDARWMTDWFEKRLRDALAASGVRLKCPLTCCQVEGEAA